ncbi:hypothetical protein SLITO_v1c04900 [Spiroplasma litorale]|uniref:Uncharacterized protein n=1 Tax=Spiroplasma litorale TaxID=216942 RepID=A0A0K1W1S3_9MOLU|nr:hypothetical protein [Spiroplasma litorale]AKX34141.1 hypothetical protein SLITO_v1c04900 [Spiroplasma litorale]
MFEEYSKISKDDAEKKYNKLSDEYKELLKLEKSNDKKLKKGLIWWLILPVAGLFIYSVLLSRRRNLDNNMQKILQIKEKLVLIELEMQYIKNKVLFNEKNNKGA